MKIGLKTWTKRVVVFLVTAAMAIALIPFTGLKTVTRAAAGDTPDAEKNITDNHDGTYTISLDIVGESEVDTENTKANIVVILDRSGSMRYYVESDTGRYGSTNNNPPSQDNVYGNNRVTLYNEDRNQVTDDTYEGTVYTRSGFPGNYNYTAYTGKRYADELRMAVAKDAVNDLVTEMQQYNTQVPNTVQMALVSFSDRASTNVAMTGTLSNITNAINATGTGAINPDGGTNWEEALRTARTIAQNADDDPTYVIFVTDGNPTRYGTGQGTGREDTDNINTSYNAARDDARAIVNDGFTLYNLGVFGNVDRMESLTTYANGATSADKGTASYYSVANKDELNKAFAEIIDQISENIGITEVDIVDGTTQTVTTESGVAHLLEVVPNSFKYYRSGGGYEDMTEWTSTDDPAPPSASFNDNTGQVEWDLSPIGVLENNVKYTVTFDVYPSQETYDLIAQLKNGDIQYSEIDPAISQYIDEETYALKTNTTASYSWTDTREEDPEEHSEDYKNPPPVATSSDTLPIKKEWEGGSPDTDEVEITVLMDEGTENEEVFHTATLTSGNDWESSAFISVGIIKDGEPLPGAMGHDFSFAELDDTHYHWEIDAPVVRPMLINGGGEDHTPTMLIKVDDKHTAPSGADTYTIDGAEYYADPVMTGLTATNHRRSNLNLTKTVTGEDAPEDATFQFTLTVNNALAPATEPEDDPEHNSDYWLWFSIDSDPDPDVYSPVTDAEVSGEGVVQSGTYWYAPSGIEITVQMKDGWNLRFTNLPSDTTYTFVEGELDDGFEFVSAELTEGEDSTFEGDQTTTGTIENTKTSYYVEYTNDYALTDLEITKDWVDADNQDGMRLTPDELKDKLTLSPEVEDAEATVVDNEDGTYTITYTGLPRYSGGQKVTYTVVESAIDGYTTTGSPAQDHGTITNTHVPETTEVTVVKVWDDSDDIGEIRPDDIQAQLKADGIESGDPVTLNEDNKWTYTWEDLPKFKDGKEIVYSADETKVPVGYSKQGPEKETAEDGTVTFTVTNTYSPQSTTASFPVKKNLVVPEGFVGPENWEYTITVTAENGAPTAEEMTGTVTKTSDTATFGPITYTAPGTYTYTVTEEGEVAGVKNDDDAETGKTVTVTVKDNGDGTLTATPDSTTASPLMFTNTYNADTITASFPVEKVLSVPDDMEGPEEWEYEITVTAENGAPEAEEMTGTVNQDNDTVTFGNFTYTVPGTYKYTVTETGVVDGVINDPAAESGITVTVEIVDNKEGKLVVQNISASTDSPLQFTNSYHELKITIPVNKTLEKDPVNLEGPDITGQYTFTISAEEGTPMPSATTVKNDEGVAMSFGPITYTSEGTYTYTVTETGEVAGVENDGPKTVTVVVTRDEKGDLNPEYTGATSFDFVNTYTVEPVTIDFPVKKDMEITGKGPKSWSYDIAVAPVDEAPAAETMTGTVSDTQDTVTFGPFEFTAPGTYEYTVTESGDIKGVTNDDDADGKKVTITVTDNKDGTMSAEASSTEDDPLTFTNTYTYKPAEVPIRVDKFLVGEIEGLNLPDITAKYEFTLTGEDGAPMPESGGEVVRNTAADGGTVYFGEITFNEPGTFTYTVTESGDVKGVTNDPDAEEGKTVTVTVEDDQEGQLIATVDYGEGNEAVAFTNTYSVEPVDVDPPVQKIFSGEDAEKLYNNGKFTFTIENVSDEDVDAPMPENTSITNSAKYELSEKKGFYEFGVITFTEPGTYKYKVTESGKVDGVTNDPEAETGKILTFEVTDNGEGQLEVSPTTDEVQISFTNKYAPQTGDHSNMILWLAIMALALAAGGTSLFFLKKSRKRG